MVGRRLALFAGTFVASLVEACKPNLDDVVSVVSQPEVIAVRAGTEGGQAEVPPLSELAFTALYIGPSGTITPASLEWAFCDERKPLAELGPVSPLCLQQAGSWFLPVGMGNPVSGAVPNDACRQFGPDVPAPQAGQPQGRPVDPDPTGGYYIPLRLLAPAATGAAVSIAEARLVCGLPSQAPPDQSSAFVQRYHPNTNPIVQSLGVAGGSPFSATTDATVDLATANPVIAGAHLQLETAWPSCPMSDTPGDGVCGPDETGMNCATCGGASSVTPVDCCPANDCTHPLGCTGAERYVLFDTTTSTLVDQREGMAVAWFATGGSFDVDRTGRDGTDPATTSDNGWTAPSQPGMVVMWIVLRDDRGGVGWKQYALDVQ
jgi:hypothetical protein